MTEVREFLERHLSGIFQYDLDSYHATTSADLGLYEWYIIPQRIDGLPFHDFLMAEAKRAGAIPLAGDALRTGERPPETHVRFDLSNYREQRYGDTAIASYTLLISTGNGQSVKVTSYNETRVILKFPEGWKVVHVHKSPTFRTPLEPPTPG